MNHNVRRIQPPFSGLGSKYDFRTTSKTVPVSVPIVPTVSAATIVRGPHDMVQFVSFMMTPVLIQISLDETHCMYVRSGHRMPLRTRTVNPFKWTAEGTTVQNMDSIWWTDAVDHEFLDHRESDINLITWSMWLNISIWNYSKFKVFEFHDIIMTMSNSIMKRSGRIIRNFINFLLIPNFSENREKWNLENHLSVSLSWLTIMLVTNKCSRFYVGDILSILVIQHHREHVANIFVNKNDFSLFSVLIGLTNGASFEKCEAISAAENESEKGPKCVDDTCQRRCNPGYTAVKPTKVILHSRLILIKYFRRHAKRKMRESSFGARHWEDVSLVKI